MIVADILFSLRTLLLAPFREPSLLWQLAPLLLLWTILVFYFATHKHEKLGWNTSLANGISLFWVVVSAMQYIFANGKQYFSWTKFGLFVFVTIYAIFLIYITFQHSFSAKVTYVLASHNAIYYFSILSLLYAYDVIFLNLPMFIAIVVLFLFILLCVAVLDKLLPELKEDDEAEFNLSHEHDFADSDDRFDDFKDSSSTSKPGGIEDAMGSGNFADNEFKL